MNRKRTAVAGAVAAGLLLLGTACSSGSGESGAPSDTKQGSESAPDGAATATSVVRQFDPGECDAAEQLYASIVETIDGDQPAEKEQVEQQLSELQSKLPTQLDGQMTAVSIAFQVYFSETADLDPADPSTAPAFQSAADGLRADSVQQARDRIDSFLAESCGSGVGG